MNIQMLQLSVLSAVLVSLLGTGHSFAASNATSSIFQLSELPGLSTGAHAVELAAKCGSGACGSKDENHKNEGEHHCGSKKDGDHKCGSTKDAQHSCDSKKDTEHKCGTGSCGSKAPQKN